MRLTTQTKADCVRRVRETISPRPSHHCTKGAPLSHSFSSGKKSPRWTHSFLSVTTSQEAHLFLTWEPLKEGTYRVWPLGIPYRLRTEAELTIVRAWVFADCISACSGA